LLCDAPRLPRRADRVGLLVESGEAIERRTVSRHVQQAVLFHLALDLDQRVAQAAQQGH
jgi:hypothetical protein